MNNTRKFEDVLDECLERILLKDETIEQCLRSFPQYADKLKPLLETALSAHQLSAIQPRPEFRTHARAQFKAALQEQGAQKKRFSFHPSWQPHWVTAVAVMLVLVLGGGATVYAASGSMPDSPIYPVKIAAEQAQLALTFSDLGKAELNAKLADKRVGEIVYLAETNKPEEIEKTTENMNRHLAQISSLVSSSAAASSFAVGPAPLQSTVPETTSPPDHEPGTSSAPTASIEPTEESSASRPAFLKPQETTDNATPPLPGIGSANPSNAENGEKNSESDRKADQQARLKNTVQNQSNANIARLKASLDKAPESAKSALKRAVDQAETEYEKANDALK